jgi:uncharacterized coiled-coil DUF342 family protein
MDNFNDSQLLMCEQEVLIKYINDLKTDRDTMLESCGDLDNMEECVGYVNDLKKNQRDLNCEVDEIAMNELVEIFEEEVASNDIPDKVRDLKEENEDLKTDRDTMLTTCGDLDNMEECVGYVNDLQEELATTKAIEKEEHIRLIEKTAEVYELKKENEKVGVMAAEWKRCWERRPPIGVGEGYEVFLKVD